MTSPSTLVNLQNQTRINNPQSSSSMIVKMNNLQQNKDYYALKNNLDVIQQKLSGLNIDDYEKEWNNLPQEQKQYFMSPTELRNDPEVQKIIKDQKDYENAQKEYNDYQYGYKLGIQGYDGRGLTPSQKTGWLDAGNELDYQDSLDRQSKQIAQIKKDLGANYDPYKNIVRQNIEKYAKENNLAFTNKTTADEVYQEGERKYLQNIQNYKQNNPNEKFIMNNKNLTDLTPLGVESQKLSKTTSWEDYQRAMSQPMIPIVSAKEINTNYTSNNYDNASQLSSTNLANSNRNNSGSMVQKEVQKTQEHPYIQYGKELGKEVFYEVPKELLISSGKGAYKELMNRPALGLNIENPKTTIAEWSDPDIRNFNILGATAGIGTSGQIGAGIVKWVMRGIQGYQLKNTIEDPSTKNVAQLIDITAMPWLINKGVNLKVAGKYGTGEYFDGYKPSEVPSGYKTEYSDLKKTADEILKWKPQNVEVDLKNVASLHNNKELASLIEKNLQSRKDTEILGGTGGINSAVDMKKINDIDLYSNDPKKSADAWEQIFKGKGVTREDNAFYYKGDKMMEINNNKLLLATQKTIYSGLKEPSTIESINGIKVANPNYLLIRKLLGGFEKGNAPERTPMYRYSKDIPRFIEGGKQVLKENLEVEKNLPPVIKQYKQWKTGRAIDYMNPYEYLENQVKAQPVKDRYEWKITSEDVKKGITKEKMDALEKAGYTLEDVNAELNTQIKYGKIENPMMKELADEIIKQEGYLGGSTAIKLQLPDGSFRQTRDLDAYFKEIDEIRMNEIAERLKKITLKYKDKSDIEIIKKEKHLAIKDIKTGEELVDLGTRGDSRDKIISQGEMKLRKLNQIEKDKREIIKNVNKNEPKYKKAKQDLELIEEGKRILETEIQNKMIKINLRPNFLTAGLKHIDWEMGMNKKGSARLPDEAYKYPEEENYKNIQSKSGYMLQQYKNEEYETAINSENYNSNLPYDKYETPAGNYNEPYNAPDNKTYYETPYNPPYNTEYGIPTETNEYVVPTYEQKKEEKKNNEKLGWIQNENMATGYQPMFYDKYDNEFAGEIYANEAEAQAEGFIFAKKGKYGKFYVRQVIVKQEEIKRGRENKQPTHFNRSGMIYQRQKANKKQRNNFNMNQYIFK